MEKKQDHYQTLGVSRSESQQGIRKAFRQRAKECHPDCVGKECEEQFKELSEAHEVLSDPNLRKEYDEVLHHRECGPGQTAWPASEPMAQSRQPFRPGELIRDVPSPRRSWKQPLAQRGIDLEVVLSKEEAAFGCTIPLVFCWDSGGFGRIVKKVSFNLSIPSGVSHGMILELDGSHVVPMRDLFIRALIKVAE